jgi:hypothetical protein
MSDKLHKRIALTIIKVVGTNVTHRISFYVDFSGNDPARGHGYSSSINSITH